MQLQFGGTWISTIGEETGTQGEVSLSEGETITRVRYWVAPEITFGVEVTTSAGAVHGPWGRTTVGNEYDVQVCV